MQHAFTAGKPVEMDQGCRQLCQVTVGIDAAPGHGLDIFRTSKPGVLDGRPVALARNIHAKSSCYQQRRALIRFKRNLLRKENVADG